MPVRLDRFIALATGISDGIEQQGQICRGGRGIRVCDMSLWWQVLIYIEVDIDVQSPEGDSPTPALVSLSERDNERERKSVFLLFFLPKVPTLAVESIPFAFSTHLYTLMQKMLNAKLNWSQPNADAISRTFQVRRKWGYYPRPTELFVSHCIISTFCLVDALNILSEIHEDRVHTTSDELTAINIKFKTDIYKNALWSFLPSPSTLDRWA